MRLINLFEFQKGHGLAVFSSTMYHGVTVATERHQTLLGVKGMFAVGVGYRVEMVNLYEVFAYRPIAGLEVHSTNLAYIAVMHQAQLSQSLVALVPCHVHLSYFPFRQFFLSVLFRQQRVRLRYVFLRLFLCHNLLASLFILCQYGFLFAFECGRVTLIPQLSA